MARNNNTLLEVKGLTKYYPVYGGIWKHEIARVFAALDISFQLQKGESLGLVGESGCGKTTLGHTLLKLIEPTSGRIFFDGEEITNWGSQQMRPLRREMQMIFQDPFESLNSRHTIGTILSEPFIIHKKGTTQDYREQVHALLDRVGLQRRAYYKYPHELSGGQRQRVGIARAIALKPKLIVCDEPVSALDVSIQSQILNLLIQLQKEMNLSYIFISHNLAVVRHISERVAVMYLGKVVEITSSKEIYKNPLHPYTKSLLASILEPDPSLRGKKRELLKGDVPSPRHPPSGCRFHTRCPLATERCRREEPKLEGPLHHLAACHYK